MTFEFRGITFEFTEETFVLLIGALASAAMSLLSGIAAIVTAFKEGQIETKEAA